VCSCLPISIGDGESAHMAACTLMPPITAGVTRQILGLRLEMGADRRRLGQHGNGVPVRLNDHGG
jgi:hypothetical protein